jgi:hypothetical protein
MQTYLSNRQGTTVPEQQVKIFNMKTMQGDVIEAVRYLTNREVGGILLPSNTDEKTGDSYAKVLASKYPEARTPDANKKLPTYDVVPDFTNLDITEDVVDQVVRRLSGSAGIGGMDSHPITPWLLCFDEASQKLRVALADFGGWSGMSNKNALWAAYSRALMAGRVPGYLTYRHVQNLAASDHQMCPQSHGK